MSTEKHTQGRLTYAKGISGYSIIAGGETIAYTTGNGSPRGMARERSGENEATARRLVACWNRLQDFTTEQIEDFGYDLFAEVRPHYEQAIRQRDELLAALQMVSDGPHDAEAIADMLPVIRAAIAKVKGGAA